MSEENVKMSRNDAEIMAEVKEYDREMNRVMEEDAINAKAKRQEADRIFRIVFGTIALIVLGIVVYRYLRVI